MSRSSEKAAEKFAKDQLKSIIERIERLLEEKKAIADDVSAVYAEAKASAGDAVMMQAPVNTADARAVSFDVAALPDLTGTPWARIWLSSRDQIWTLVDADDVAWLSQWQWNVWHAGRNRHDSWMLYAKRNVGPSRATLRMHRELSIKDQPDLDEQFLRTHVVDHINGQTLDNRRANRRWLTKPHNAVSRRPRGTAPTLDAIVRELLDGLSARPQLEDIPFD